MEFVLLVLKTLVPSSRISLLKRWPDSVAIEGTFDFFFSSLNFLSPLDTPS